MGRRTLAVALVLALGGALVPGAALAAPVYHWKVVRLTDNEVSDDAPAVSGDGVVWRGWDGNDYEIYAWAPGGGPPMNISNRDGVEDRDPQISGDRVVWEGFREGDFADWEIFTWKLGDAAPTNISNRMGMDDENPQVSGDRVVWRGHDGIDWEVFTWTPGAPSPTNLTNNIYLEWSPQVSGDRVVWGMPVPGQSEVFTWTPGDAAPENLSDTDLPGGLNPQVSGNRVVWAGWDETYGDEIYTCVVGSGDPVRISNNPGFADLGVRVSGDRVVWQGTGGSDGGDDHEVFTWTPAGGVVQTVNGNDDLDPEVSGDVVVWQRAGEIYAVRPGDAAPVNVSDRPQTDYGPEISGDRIVWNGYGTSFTSDIFTATLVTDIGLEHDGAGVVFDRWVTGYSAAYSGGGYVYGRWTGTRLTAVFVGSSISWTGPKQPGYGMADIWIDGAKVATDVDCYASDADKTLSATIWESDTLPRGAHTIELRLEGRKNPASTGYVVVLDRLTVTGATPQVWGTRVDDSLALPGYSGTWLPYVNPTYFNKTYAYSRWAGSAFTLDFTGTQVAWIGPRTPNYGIAEVWIDGAKVATVDCYRADLATQGWREAVWVSGVLAAGPHTLSIRPTGTKNAAATAANVVIDAIDVRP